MNRGAIKSAQQTNGNSPAIYRWGRKAKFETKSAQRTTENSSNYAFSVARFTGFEFHISILYPALKCWAIFTRPLRGLYLPLFRRSACFVFAFCLLPTAYCLLAVAQPGMPQPNSPLYGGGANPGQVSTGLPAALKK